MSATALKNLMICFMLRPLFDFVRTADTVIFPRRAALSPENKGQKKMEKFILIIVYHVFTQI